ncbi:response regulator [Alcaligenaceae bacterium]|nr:response regulator [Alcaligenaceae bacterium]
MSAAVPGTCKPLILCVEDEIDLRDDLVEELEAAGYKVIVADNGGEALQRLDTIRPDLILCDVTMPDTDGYEVLNVLRGTRPDMSDVPFVFLTAQAGSEHVVRGKRAGADDYLVKPIDFDLMLATIHARLAQVSRIQLKLATEINRIGSSFSERHEASARRAFKRVTQTLDYVAAGIVLLDAIGTVRFANRAARLLVDDEAGDKGLLRLIDKVGTHGIVALNKAVTAAIAAYQAGEDYVDSLAIPRPEGQRSLLVTVCALDDYDLQEEEAASVLAVDKLASEERLAVAIFISDSEYRRPAPVDTLISLFGLTATEAQVAWAFAEGKRSEEIAASFGISPTTVSFHKRNLFQKTHTNRQADLIALMLTLPLPAA